MNLASCCWPAKLSSSKTKNPLQPGTRQNIQSVPTWGYVLDGLDVPAHHQDGALDGLLVQVLLLAGHKVGAHDAGLHARRHLAGEDAAERVEATLVSGRHHFWDVHHERRVRVAVLVFALERANRSGSPISVTRLHVSVAIPKFNTKMYKLALYLQAACIC